MKIADKKILVTGATGGIGKELCGILSHRGARLLLSCFDEKQLIELRSCLGDQHQIIPADISTAEGRARIVTASNEAEGIDGVVNLAGILDFNLFTNQPEAVIEKILAVNLVGMMLLSRGLLPSLLSKPEASMVNIGSTFGSIGYPGFAAYCASKAGIRCFTEALSRELADSSLHISYIAPRATSTGLNSDRVNAMNQALGNKSDSPDYVARQITKVLMQNPRTRYLGWPEKLFVQINALIPSVVHKTLVRQLSVIKQFTNQ